MTDEYSPRFWFDFNNPSLCTAIAVGDDAIVQDSDELEVPAKISALRAKVVDGVDCVVIDFEKTGAIRDHIIIANLRKMLAHEYWAWTTHYVTLREGEEHPPTFEAWLQYWGYLEKGDDDV